MEKAIDFVKNLDVQKVTEILLAIGIIIMFRILSSIISGIIIKLLRPKTKEKKDVRKNPFYLPLKTIISFLGIYIALNMVKGTLRISTEIVNLITKIIKISMILLVAKAFGDGLNTKNLIFTKIKSKAEREIDETTLKFAIRILKIVIYFIAGFMVISELGYNISGVITGLGIGSVVITLAAQDTAKSLIGGLAIFFDRPFKVGDYIKVGQYEGTVEDIKFRSTNIRTLENSVLHVPNSEMAISAIINYSEIQKRRYYSELIVELNTSLERIQDVQKKIKNMLNSNKMIKKDSVHVNFQAITDNGIKLVIMAYINEADYFKYIRIKEEINYNIMEILRNENIELAYNTQTIYVKK